VRLQAHQPQGEQQERLLPLSLRHCASLLLLPLMAGCSWGLACWSHPAWLLLLLQQVPWLQRPQLLLQAAGCAPANLQAAAS
jgi:hypothetical protein